MVKGDDPMGNFQECEQVNLFLRSLRLTLKEDSVKKVLLGLKCGSSQYDLSMYGKYADGRVRQPQASPGTVRKIARLY